MMRTKSISIIGGGLAGLATGCYARMNGYRPHIFEHHTIPGGVCTAWKRKGYTIDGCIHWLMGCKPDSAFHRVYRELGALESDPLRPLTHYGRLVDEASGEQLDLTSDLDRLERDMREIAPGDSRAIRSLIAGARAVMGIDTYPEKPQELFSVRDGMAQLWRMRRVLPLLARYSMSAEAFAKRFRSPFLRWAVANTFTPEMPTLFLFMILGQLASGELAAVNGGSLRFAEAIARRYEGLGGEITYGATVEEILVEDDRAVGVRLQDGTEHRADIVVSAADAHSTLFDMLGGRCVDAGWRERFEKWPLFDPVLFVSFGVAREFDDEPALRVLSLRDPIAVGDHQAHGMWLRLSNVDPSLAPPGKTVVQATLEASFDYWWILKEDRARYEAEKEHIADEVLKRIETHLPGAAAAVEMTDVATPYTLWRYTRNHRAAFEGWAMTPRMFTARVPKRLPGLGGFYMAGQWVEPGGGVPPVLCSGRNVVWLICHEDGRPFVATEP